MATTTFSIRMDSDLKHQLDVLCDEFGMTTTTALNICAKAIVRERRIPFEIKASDDNKGLKAFQSLRTQAKENDIQDMSSEEINEEIAKTRRGED